MSDLARRRVRVNGTPAQKMLQGRVAPEVHALAQRKAHAAGLPIAVYLEELVLRDEVDENDCPVWAARDQEELPLNRSA